MKIFNCTNNQSDENIIIFEFRSKQIKNKEIPHEGLRELFLKRKNQKIIVVEVIGFSCYDKEMFEYMKKHFLESYCIEERNMVLVSPDKDDIKSIILRMIYDQVDEILKENPNKRIIIKDYYLYGLRKVADYYEENTEKPGEIIFDSENEQDIVKKKYYQEFISLEDSIL